MRISLEYEDEPAFATVRHSKVGDYRVLLVKVNGKPFSTWANVAPIFLGDRHYMEQIDRSLVAAMERMLKKVFTDACAAIPEGTDLLVDKEKNADISSVDE